MRHLRFNFNNEVDSFEIIQEDDGMIRVPMPGGDEITYDSLQQFAEFYAQARDVKPERLKNWTLVENGDVVSFILRAGVAGVTAQEARESLDQVFREMREDGSYHPLEIERVKQALNDSEDIMRTLAMSDRPELAQAIYDRLDQMGVFTEPEPEPEPEPDTRSDMERYLDEVLERDKTLAFFGMMLNIGPGAEKDEILAELENSTIPYNVGSLSELYENAILSARENGIHVDDRFDAILVMSQNIPVTEGNTDHVKLVNSARMAGRDFLNVVEYTVGHRHIRKDATILPLDDLNGTELVMKGNVPITVTYDQTVDEELEKEKQTDPSCMDPHRGRQSLTGADVLAIIQNNEEAARQEEEETPSKEEDYEYDGFDGYDDDYDEYE